ncbi:MAG: MFS transporter [Chitinophagales bacterium]|nr:MFS transporter [Chitinophagales bacterium]
MSQQHDDKELGTSGDLPINETSNVPVTGHPPGLYWLFFAEMWERFCYYGMRALLVLYLTKTLMVADARTFAIYGAYTALVYAVTVLGGKLADSLLGYRIAVIMGGFLMALGEFMILGGGEFWLLMGMAVIISGNGYFKANISSIVGRLYADGDPRRDSGFTIFYIGINLGAFLATTVVAEVGNRLGYEYGFGLAGIGMVLGAVVFMFGQKHYEGHGLPPDRDKLLKPAFGPLSRLHVVILATLAVIPVFYLLLNNSAAVGVLLGLVAAIMLFILLYEGFKGGAVLRDRMIILILLMFFNIVFWACFEQAGSSLTLFADRNVNRHVFGTEIGAATTQFFNPLYILIFGSIFSVMWVKLSKIGKNPNIPMKFGLGIVQLGLGYLVVQAMMPFVGADYKMPLLTLVFLYMLHTTGELFLSPIGLSMVTKLAPKHMTGMVMGAWFLSIAGANYVAAILAQLTGAGHGEGGGAVEASAEQTLHQYVDIYTQMGMITVGIGLVLVILSKPLNKLMHGVT